MTVGNRLLIFPNSLRPGLAIKSEEEVGAVFVKQVHTLGDSRLPRSKIFVGVESNYCTQVTRANSRAVRYGCNGLAVFTTTCSYFLFLFTAILLSN